MSNLFNAATHNFVPSNGIYLLSHSVGRPLRTTPTYLAQKFFAPWEAGDPWGEWLNALNEFGQALSGLLNSPAENFCPQTNLSSALTKVLFALPQQPGKSKILLSPHDFPSMGFVAQQTQQLGYELIFLPTEADATDPEVWAKALTPEVQWVLITHVQSNTGVQVPVTEVATLARQRGIISIVDIAQSVGVLPIDLAAWNADFVIGSCVKWLCGGPGAGYLWVNSQRVAESQPRDVGWFSHANPFEFDIQHFQYHPGALRFWGGTPSVLPYVVATHSIQYLTQLGIPNIRAHNVALTERILATVAADCVVSPKAPHQRGGTLVLNFGSRQAAVAERLKQQQVRFDVRPLGLRLSPHIYTTPAEVETVCAALAA